MFGPNPEAITVQLTADYAATSLLMAWCHTLLNTSLYPVQPKPPWYDGVATRLETAKSATQRWLTREYPDIASALPQSLIDYGNGLGPAVDELAPLVAKPRLEDGDRDDVVAVIEGLRRRAQTQHWRVRGLQKKVGDFAELVAGVAAQAAVDSRDVLASAGAANQKVVALQAELGALQRQLGTFTAEAKGAMDGAATTGASVTMTLMAFTISAGVGAAAFPVFGLAGAFIGIGINAAIEASKSEQVRQTIREIGRLSIELSAEQHQVAALQVMADSLQHLSDRVAASKTTLAGTVHHWDDICTDLDLARELVDQPAIDLTRLTPFAQIRKAKASWATILDAARKIQSSTFEVHTAPILLSGDVA